MSRNLQQYNGKRFPEPTLLGIIPTEGSVFSAQPDVLACHVVRNILSSSFHGPNIWDAAVELLCGCSPLFWRVLWGKMLVWNEPLELGGFGVSSDHPGVPRGTIVPFSLPSFVGEIQRETSMGWEWSLQQLHRGEQGDFGEVFLSEAIGASVVCGTGQGGNAGIL